MNAERIREVLYGNYDLQFIDDFIEDLQTLINSYRKKYPEKEMVCEECGKTSCYCKETSCPHCGEEFTPLLGENKIPLWQFWLRQDLGI